MPRYIVRVERTYEEEWVDIEVDARSAADARCQAQAEARATACTYFGPPPEPSYNVCEIERME